MDKTEKKKEEKYNSILSAAFSLFEKNGMSTVPIDDIVKKAGVAKGTFYLYFKDKMDLISRIILKEATEYLKSKDGLVTVNPDANFDEYIKVYINTVIDFLQKNKTLTALIDKNMHICVNAVIENREGALKDIYNMIIGDFSKRGFDKKETEIKLYLYLNMIVSACCNAILRERPYSMSEIEHYLYNIIMGSIEYSMPQKSEA